MANDNGPGFLGQAENLLRTHECKHGSLAKLGLNTATVEPVLQRLEQRGHHRPSLEFLLRIICKAEEDAGRGLTASELGGLFKKHGVFDKGTPPASAVSIVNYRIRPLVEYELLTRQREERDKRRPVMRLSDYTQRLPRRATSRIGIHPSHRAT